MYICIHKNACVYVEIPLSYAQHSFLGETEFLPWFQCSPLTGNGNAALCVRFSTARHSHEC